ncbi:MAG: hypothetical protein S4CHLAM123_14810 [Chlamydiales bacterium]|nr:hypothetical protein [Chlamydiales bacterium]
MGSNIPSRPELDEKDFVQERGPRFVWIFLFLFLATVALIWGVGVWQKNIEKERLKKEPFYQVTNRDFSLFLWDFPEYMRSNHDLSEAYLPHFHTRDQIHVIPELADEYVSAPPSILYLYQTWNRLLGERISSQPISERGYALFLQENPEWLPEYWKMAPEGYKKLVSRLNKLGNQDLQSLSDEVLPLKARRAYQGWLNFARDWEKIHLFMPKKEEVEAFIESNPHYARNYWCNLLPHYLEPFNSAEIPYFLKRALYSTTTNPSA